MKEEIIVEIPKGSHIKYEIDNGRLRVDRVLFGANHYPANYGYFENTLDWDGDPLDALVISNDEFMPGSVVPIRILGAMQMMDGGETDTKIIGVIDVDPRFDTIKNLKDVPKHYLSEIQDFFENYKNLQVKKVEVVGFKDLDYAKKELEETKLLYLKYKDLPKGEFVKKMYVEHPEKYK